MGTYRSNENSQALAEADMNIWILQERKGVLGHTEGAIGLLLYAHETRKIVQR